MTFNDFDNLKGSKSPKINILSIMGLIATMSRFNPCSKVFHLENIILCVQDSFEKFNKIKPFVVRIF